MNQTPDKLIAPATYHASGVGAHIVFRPDPSVTAAVLVLAASLLGWSPAALANGGHGNFGGRAGGYTSSQAGGGHSNGAQHSGAHNPNRGFSGQSGNFGGRSAPAIQAPSGPPRSFNGGHYGAYAQRGSDQSFGTRSAYSPQIAAPAIIRPAPAVIRVEPARVYAPTYTESHGYRAPAVVYSNNYGRAAPYYGGSRWSYSSGFRPHHHRYPNIGLTVPALAVGAFALSYAGASLYFDRGIWYRPTQYGNYIVAAPPYGAVIPTLPLDYATINYGGVPYYYGNGVYYTEVPGQGYAVTPAPSGLPPVTGNGYEPFAGATGANAGDALALAQLPDVQIAPRNDQSSAQLFSDRADCSRWAAGQSGFDPARGRPADAQGWENAKAYRDAEVSCLQARGYEAR